MISRLSTTSGRERIGDTDANARLTLKMHP
jgi:hypothetical protein